MATRGDPSHRQDPRYRGAVSAWTWEYARFDGSPVPRAPGDGRRVRPRQPDEGFPVQVDAETWMGRSWGALLSSGVETAFLHRDGAVVYGPLELAVRS